MSLLSLRDHLKKIGEPKPGKAGIALPSDFHSTPGSLRAAMHAMLSPQIEKWIPIWQSTFEQHSWTEECQGLTSNGQFWYVSSNNKDIRAIYKFTLGFQVQGLIPMPIGLGEHIGAPDYYDGKIYVPIEPGAKVWVLDAAGLTTVQVADLGGKPGGSPQENSMPWCAINPWNGYLYSSTFDDVDCVHVYDLKNNFVHKDSLVLEGEILQSVQGGCFSNNGHLYLTSGWTDDIRAYSALNGAFLGRKEVSYVKGGVDQEEMEGLAILPITINGIPAQVHVVILDNDLSLDDVFLKHFAVPNPDDL